MSSLYKNRVLYARQTARGRSAEGYLSRWWCGQRGRCGGHPWNVSTGRPLGTASGIRRHSFSGSYAVTKPGRVVFKNDGKLEHTGTGPGMQGETRMGFEGTFKINRMDYDVAYMPQAVGTDVTIRVALEATK